jgi:hypothetical protein
MPHITVQAHAPDQTLRAVTLTEGAALQARSDAEDEAAAAWLCAWASDALRPQHQNLAARITNGA